MKEFKKLSTMVTPEPSDQNGEEGGVGSSNWPKFVPGFVVIDEINPHKANGGRRNATESRREKPLLLISSPNPNEMKHHLELAVASNWTSTDDIEVVIVDNSESYEEHIFGSNRSRAHTRNPQQSTAQTPNRHMFSP
jgi:hypothetical protein